MIGVFLRVAMLVLLFPGPAWSFVQSTTSGGQPVQWTRRCIPFHINELGSDDIDFNTLVRTIQSSLNTWSSVQCSDKSLTYEGLTDSNFIGFDVDGANINTIMFRETPSTWEHSRNVIALTTVVFCEEARGQCERVGQIMDADIEFNGAYHRFSASTPVPFNRFDFENSLTHELGHLLGFDHSPDLESTMYASAPEGESLKRSLADDDITAMCTVYPIQTPIAQCESSDITGDYYPGPTQVVDNEMGYETTPESSGCDCAQYGTNFGPQSWLISLLALLLFVRTRWAWHP